MIQRYTATACGIGIRSDPDGALVSHADHVAEMERVKDVLREFHDSLLKGRSPRQIVVNFDELRRLCEKARAILAEEQ